MNVGSFEDQRMNVKDECPRCVDVEVKEKAKIRRKRKSS